MSTQLRFDPDDDDVRDTAYELMGVALTTPPSASGYRYVLIGDPEKDGSCIVWIGRLAMRVVDWWEDDLNTVVGDTISRETGIADARGPEAASNPDAGI